MKIHEYQGKALLKGYGVKVPEGGAATTIEEARALAPGLGPVVAVKAQIHAGGRGKGTLDVDWRGKPLVSHEVIVKLIAATTTRTGLRVRSGLDTNEYPKGVSVPDADMETLHLKKDAFHGEWNYSLLPRLMLPQE